MKKDTKGAIIVIAAAVLITVVIFMVTRNKGGDRTNVGNTSIQSHTTVAGEFTNVLEDGTRINTSTKLHETKKFEGIEISNFQLTEKDNMTVLLGTMTNISNVTKGGYAININVVDKAGREIATVPAYIKELLPGESTQLNTRASKDFANAYDFTITKGN